MDPVARKVIGVLAVVAGIILGIVALLTTRNPDPFLAGGVIADAVGIAVLLL
jgi:xanthosine utilization system XapX-like protein